MRRQIVEDLQRLPSRVPECAGHEVARAAIGPAAAVVVGGGAAVGLVVLRTQRKRHKRRAQARGARDLALRTLKDAGREARKVFDEFR